MYIVYNTYSNKSMLAGVAQLVERKTQDPKIAGSIPGGGIFYNVKLIKNLA